MSILVDIFHQKSPFPIDKTPFNFNSTNYWLSIISLTNDISEGRILRSFQPDIILEFPKKATILFSGYSK